MFDPLRDDEIVYVALRNKTYMDEDTGEILPSAFLLRERDLGPENGVSVIICDHAPSLNELKELVPNLRSKVCGIDAVRVGDIRRLGLDVIRDASHHAYIKGLPYIHAENSVEARRATTLSEQLASISRLVRR